MTTHEVTVQVIIAHATASGLIQATLGESTSLVEVKVTARYPQTGDLANPKHLETVVSRS